MTLVLVILLNSFVLHEFYLRSFLFFFGIIHTVGKIMIGIERGMRRTTYTGLITILMLADVS